MITPLKCKKCSSEMIAASIYDHSKHLWSYVWWCTMCTAPGPRMYSGAYFAYWLRSRGKNNL